MMKKKAINIHLIYIYCITDIAPQLEKIAPNNGLKSFSHQDYYAVVKYVSADDFSEENFKTNLADISWIESNAREHIQVISQVMENNTVIPCKFGTVFKSEENLENFIRCYSGSLKKSFEIVSGKEEWSVKVYYNPKTLSDKIADQSEEVRVFEQKIMDSSPGKAYLLNKKKADIIKLEAEKMINNYGQKCFDRLKEISVLFRLNNLLPKELTERDDEMILNVSYLVKKQNVTNLINTVKAIKDEYITIGLEVEHTGPWPPFNFISLNKENG